MDFDYTPNQRELRDEARRFLTERCPLTLVRQAHDDQERRVSDGLWRAIGELGWCGVAIPDAYGGLGLTRVELAAIAEEIGASLAPIPFGSTLYLFAEALLLCGSEEQKAEWLPRIASGEITGCAAIFEGPGDLAFERIEAHARDGRLTGTKTAVVDGGSADVAVVVARHETGLGLFLARLNDSVERSALNAIDASLEVAQLTFRNCPAEFLGVSNEAMIEQWLAHAATMFAFEQIGGADRCLRITTDYVKERQAFGGPVGRFQAVKHKLADLYVANELARSHAYHAVWAAESGDMALGKAAASARLAAVDAYWKVSREMIHLHGAMGFTWEHDAHLFYRRAHHLSLALGSPSWWKDRLFSLLVA